MTANPSGITPLDLSVLVYPPKSEEFKKSESGLLLIPDSAAERQKFGATTAKVVAVGDNAFSEWGATARKPQVGDTVVIGQYEGFRQKGADGEDYTILVDKQIFAIVEAKQ